MQKRLGGPGLCEIVRGVQKSKICDEGGAGDDAIISRTERPQDAEQLVVPTQRERRGKREQEHDQQGGKNPANAALIKIREGKRTSPQIVDDAGGDEIAGNDKEDIDADEAARNRSDIEMKGDDRQNRNRAQAVDVRPVVLAPVLARQRD